MSTDGEANVGQAFTDLPMSQLIGAPLKSVCDSQIMLAAAAYDYMMKIGFEGGDSTKGAKLISFDLQRPVETKTGITTNKVTVQAPFLGLVPIPALLVEDVNIEFQMEVTASTQSHDKTDAEVSASVKGGWGPVSVEVSGKVTTSRENTRSTNQSAKYQVRVHARQQPPTEGLSKLMDILASCTAPIKVGA